MNAHACLNIVALNNCWENVHPDVVYAAEGFAGYPYWMVFTPYPLMNDRLENPTIRASCDGIDWQRVPGTPDPIVPPPARREIHNADPELVFDSGTLHLVYLTIKRRARNTVFYAMSCGSDLQWSKPERIHEDVGAVSPTYQVNRNTWHEWFIRRSPPKWNQYELIHREGSSLTSLGDERSCKVEIPGHAPWHIDVISVGEGYEALIAAFPRGTDRTRTRLFHLSSRDGLTFRLSENNPIIQPSRFGWDNRAIYRSSFLRERNGTYRIWYSAASWGRHFGIGLLQGPLGSLTEAPAPFAPVPRYIYRLPGELAGWLRYQLRHIILGDE